ncbi:hypothetical protein G9A89_012895 [Geosiphon pyriformis]|nr:hypothetical protein G9A89_012895 [Geosiphon pyriformis]
MNKESNSVELPNRHYEYMYRALALAQEAYDNREVPVGCVFVYNDEIIGVGRNRTNEAFNGTRHAEFEAIDAILADSRYLSNIFHECVLYVTVEPCVMCAYALRQLVKQKVLRKCILGVRMKDLAPYPSIGGFLREEAIMLLRKFYNLFISSVAKKKTSTCVEDGYQTIDRK